MDSLPPLPPDPWQTLDLKRDADITTIRKAHRKLVLLTHPDRVPEKADEFRVVQTAYEILSDPDRLKEYHSLVREHDFVRRREQERVERRRDEAKEENPRRTARTTAPRRSDTYDDTQSRAESYTRARNASPDSLDERPAFAYTYDSDDPPLPHFPRPRMRRGDTYEDRRARRAFSDKPSARFTTGSPGTMPKKRPEQEKEPSQPNRAKAKKASDKARKQEQKLKRDQITPYSSEDEKDGEDEDRPPFSPTLEAAFEHERAKRSAATRPPARDYFSFDSRSSKPSAPPEAKLTAAQEHIARTKDRLGKPERPSMYRSNRTSAADAHPQPHYPKYVDSSSGDDTIRQSSRTYPEPKDKLGSRSKRPGPEDRRQKTTMPPPPPPLASRSQPNHQPQASSRSAKFEIRSAASPGLRQSLPVRSDSSRRPAPPDRSSTSPAPLSNRRSGRSSLPHVKVGAIPRDSGYFSSNTPSPPNRGEENEPPFAPHYDMGTSATAKDHETSYSDQRRDRSPRDRRSNEKRSDPNKRGRGEAIPKSAPYHSTSHPSPMRASPILRPPPPPLSRGQTSANYRVPTGNAYTRPPPGEVLYTPDTFRDLPSRSKGSRESTSGSKPLRPRAPRAQTERSLR